MTFVVAQRLTSARRLGAATLFTATALLAMTTATVADPATVSAKPNNAGWDEAAYQSCIDEAGDRYVEGEIDATEYGAALANCCIDNGGMFDFTEFTCDVPGSSSDDDSSGQGPWPSQQLPQLPPGQTEATQPPAPPTGPILQPPSPPAQQQAPA